MRLTEQMNGLVTNGHSNARDLPIYSAKNSLLKYIGENATCVIIGETASGKTTRIPQFLYEAGFAQCGAILCTQPRRVAAITVASYMAGQLCSEVGGTVGYAVRFEDVCSNETYIKYATDGIVLREAVSDPLLLNYDVIIIDEAHERTIHTDILLGVVKAAQERRLDPKMNDLKIIVMSATMEVELFSEYFNNAPILYVEGRQYEIETFFCATEEEDYIYSSLVAVFQVHRDAPLDGDILLFLTGEAEIESAARTIRLLSKELTPPVPDISVLPLYAALPPPMQMKVFQTSKEFERPTRRVVISTNIAETSVTIPNIKYVIDSGKAKEKHFNPKSGVEYLVVDWISRAQALQRAGRAGRLGAGKCYRLYTQDRFHRMQQSRTPEILKCNLDHVVLQLVSLGVSDVAQFDFIQSPGNDFIVSSVNTLRKLGAIERKSKDSSSYLLTKRGEAMVKFPLSPVYSLALLYAKEANCVEEMLTIVSMLSVESVQCCRESEKDRAVQAWSKFNHPSGDLITVLQIYRGYNAAGNHKKKWCQENYFNPRNLQTAGKIRQQLRKLCVGMGITIGSCGSNFDRIRLCLANAFRLQMARVLEPGKYHTDQGRVEVSIHPTSCLFNTSPSCVVYDELVRTTKAYMRGICVVDADWIKTDVPDQS